MSPTEITTWLETLYSSTNVDEAIDHIFNQFDDWLKQAGFQIADEALSLLDFEKLNIDLIVAVLSATLPAKARLPNHVQFARTAREVFEKTETPDEVEALLSGLE
ncbi:MAG: hypothetical protein V1848_02565 [Candidatus Magasanikbacteria bacterium]